jgi:hypothetical protein
MHGDEMPCVGAFDFAMIWGMISEAPRKLFHLDYRKRAANRTRAKADAKAASQHNANSVASDDDEALQQAR